MGSAIIMPPRAICWSICETPSRKRREEQARVEQRRAALALAADEPPDQRGHRDEADRDQDADGLAALLPDEDAEDDAAHPDRREGGADGVDRARPGVGHVVDELQAGQHEHDHDRLEREADAPRQRRRDEAADQRPDRGRDRRRRPDQA